MPEEIWRSSRARGAPDGQTGGGTTRGDTVPTTEALHLGTRLDEHHRPETNGRMAICRRCGSQTDDIQGHQHVPNERQLGRSNDWLDAQSRLSHFERLRQLHKE